MNDTLLISTDLFRSPSFFKGAARIVDLRGKLDSYRCYSKEKADTKSLKRDWITTGQDISDSLQNGQKE